MFDPEKVKRGNIDLMGDEFVLAADYDQLLALYLRRQMFIAEVRETCFDDSEWAKRIDSGARG